MEGCLHACHWCSRCPCLCSGICTPGRPCSPLRGCASACPHPFRRPRKRVERAKKEAKRREKEAKKAEKKRKRKEEKAAKKAKKEAKRAEQERKVGAEPAAGMCVRVQGAV